MRTAQTGSSTVYSLSSCCSASPAAVMHKYRADFAYNLFPRLLFDRTGGPLNSVANPEDLSPDPDLFKSNFSNPLDSDQNPVLI
jgi:hypothetical protein